MLIYSILGSIARTSLTRRCWFQPISARCGLDKPTARLISHGESNYLGSLPEYMLFLLDPRHVQPHSIAPILPKLIHLQYIFRYKPTYSDDWLHISLGQFFIMHRIIVTLYFTLCLD